MRNLTLNGALLVCAAVGSIGMAQIGTAMAASKTHSASRSAAGLVQLRGIDVVSSSVGAKSPGVQALFELSGPAHYKLTRLDHPERIVIDLDSTRLAHGARIQRDNDLVRSVRTGARPDGGLRIVLELSRAMRSCASWNHGAAGQRLVLALADRPDCSPQAMAARVTSPPNTSARVVSRAADTPLPGPASSGPASPSIEGPIRAAHAPRIDDRPVVIAVDAGHGGEDPGAIGHGGTREKDVTLAIARALARRINAEPGMRAVLTRDGDRFIALRDRILRARAAQADLFVSVHADSIADRDVSGSSVYVLSERGATNENARWLAERENAADLKGGVKLGDKDNVLASVLLDLSQTASISASMVAAQRVIHALDQVGEVRKPQVQQAGFVVLKSPDIPSMLVETAYISNPHEELRLRTAAQQNALADAIFGGLRSYFADNPPPGTRLAQVR